MDLIATVLLISTLELEWIIGFWTKFLSNDMF